MREKFDIAGMVFGRLTVSHQIAKDGRSGVRWMCACECGGEKITYANRLRRGLVKSCGCLAKEQWEKVKEDRVLHGHTIGKHSPTYMTWRAMISRCTYEKSDSYKYYGAVGITVCSDWMSFESFIRDMGERPAGMTLDRKDGSKGYSKDNCKWSSKKDQSRNRKSNHLIVTPLGEMCIAEAAEMYGINKRTLSNRINNGWNVDRAIHEPIKNR